MVSVRGQSCHAMCSTAMCSRRRLGRLLVGAVRIAVGAVRIAVGAVRMDAGAVPGQALGDGLL